MQLKHSHEKIMRPICDSDYLLAVDFRICWNLEMLLCLAVVWIFYYPMESYTHVFCRTRMQMQIYPLLFNFQRSIWQFMTKWNKVWHFLQVWKLCSGLFNASFPYLCHLKIFNVSHSYLKLHNQCKLLIHILEYIESLLESLK